jgi:hypothetical protein
MAKATSNHFVHGHAGNNVSPTYKTWRGMKLRCNNPSNASYKNYGAKGISYCERWETFELFLEDMGERPEGMTLDRKDRSKDYCLENCRWATRKEQSQDRSITVWIEHDGRKLCLSDWAAETGIGLTTLKYRLDAGWSVERALTTPPRLRHG